MASLISSGPKALAGRQVEDVARHLVAVRHPDVSRSVAATRGASHAHDALANAVVEQVDRELQWLIVVEDSRIDRDRAIVPAWGDRTHCYLGQTAHGYE